LGVTRRKTAICRRYREPILGPLQARTRQRDWLADQLARLEVRYPEVHLVFADTRRYAEDWTYRFLTTALTDTTDPNPNGD
jgi:hypothetical protein